MATTDLVSLTEAKLSLGLTDTSQDEKVTAIVASSSARVLAYLQNAVVIQARTEYHTGGKKRLFLQRYPLVSGPTITDGAGNTIPSTDYTTLPEQGILQHAGLWPTAQDANGNISRWTVVYSAGVAVNTAAVPADIKAACLVWVARQFSRPDQSVTSKRIGDLSLSYEGTAPDQGGVPADIAAMLAPYVSQGF
jgi:hypothetical protein